MSKRRRSADTGNQLIGVVAIIAVAIFVVGVIFIFAKSLFSGVEADVPKGLDTATVANAAAQTEAVQSDDSKEQTEETKKTKKTKKTEATEEKKGLGTKTVQEYAYLRKDPSPEGEQVICMSPGIVVTVLSKEDENGYVQASFDYNGTLLEGWVHSSYLA